MTTHIHQGQAIATQGAALEDAKAAMIIIHGRGGTNEQALSLTDFIHVEGFAYLAPQARDMTWYPNPFIVPRAHNEPHLSSALSVVDGLIKQVQAAGIPTEKIMLLGFSQGACLVSEYAARNPQRFGGVMVLSGGLIGAEAELTGYSGALQNTPVFLGCSDVDSHIPEGRVQQSADILKALGGDVEMRIYPGMGHTIIQDEINYVKHIMTDVLK